MAVDKLVDSTQLDSDLTSVANAIRTKGGTSSQLAFPSGFVTAVQNIPTGGVTPTGNIDITQSGVTDVTNYATATVPSLTLGEVSLTPVGTQVDVINPSTTSTQYLNIPTGFHNSAQYYSIPALALGTKTITENGTYNAIVDSVYGYSSVTVNVSGGGITPTGTKQITANGQGIDVYSYQYADVAVPNSYSAGDEGKVVSNGALVAQTSDTVTQNGTVDTTLINSLTVNVSGGSKTNIDIGIQNTPIPNILNMFYALENGTAKTGEFTPATALPNTSTALFDTELTTVHGLFIADESQATLNTGNTPENLLFAFVTNPVEEDSANNIFNFDYAIHRTNIRLYQYKMSSSTLFVNRGKWVMTNGVFYYTAPYNKNDNYSAFSSGHTYRWVAW